MPPRAKKPKTTIAAAGGETVSTGSTDTIIASSGASTATSIASADNAMVTGGVPVSTSGGVGALPDTNTSEGDASGAGDLASPAPDLAFNPRNEVLRVTHMNQLANFAEQVEESVHHRVITFFTSHEFPEVSPPSAIRVTSHADGFRRAGVSHPKAPQDYPLDHFHPDQLEILLGEPVLTVELI